MTKTLVIIIATLSLFLGLTQLQLKSLKLQAVQDANDIALLNLQKQHLAESISQKDRAITALRDAAEQVSREQDRLHSELSQLEQLANQHQQYIRDLQDENQELRDWAKQPLPQPIVRLRQRPAITGANRYCEHLRNTRALQTQSIECREQR